MWKGRERKGKITLGREVEVKVKKKVKVMGGKGKILVEGKVRNGKMKQIV